jgi:hypothetical protein
MEPQPTDRTASLGDRAVAIAGFIAIVATGFFGAEPEPAPHRLAAPSVQTAQR